MVVHKKPKCRKMRGSRKCGFGRNHRGSGNSGGKGNASGGKKSDTKKQSFPADYFGKNGFIAHNSTPVRALTCRDLDTRIERWLADGKAKKEGDKIKVDLGTLGFGKLIGSCKILHKMNVSVDAASKGVPDALKQAGGELVAKE